MAKQRRVYPVREKSLSEKLSIVEHEARAVQDLECDLAAIEAAQTSGATTWGMGDRIDSALPRYRSALDARRAALARLEQDYGSLESLAAQFRAQREG